MANFSELRQIERGIVRQFSEADGYGFIDVQGGGSLFFHVIELAKIGLARIEPRTWVKFTRGFDGKRRQRVAKFIEIDGAPVGRGTYSVDKGKIILLSSTPSCVRAVVERYIPLKSYGFASWDGRSALFHAQQQGYGTTVSFRPYRSHNGKPVPAEGDTVLLWIVEGKSNIAGKAIKWILEKRADKPVAPSSNALDQSEPIIRTSRKDSETGQKPILSTDACRLPPKSDLISERKISLPSEDEWIDVRVRKLRPDKVSYGDTDRFGKILIPWSVLLKTKIKGVKKDETLQVKCRLGENQLIAFQVRR